MPPKRTILTIVMIVHINLAYLQLIDTSISVNFQKKNTDNGLGLSDDEVTLE